MAARRRPLAPLVLALVALGLGLYIWRVDSKRPDSEQAQRERMRLLPGLEDRMVERIEFTSPTRKWAIARRPQTDAGKRKAENFADARELKWDLVEPGPARADQGQVSGLIGRLAELDRVRTVAQPGGDAAQYGLAAPAGTITLALNEDAAARGLPKLVKWEVGGATPFPGERYLRDQSGAVEVTADGLLAGFEIDPATLRDRRLFSYDPAAVRTIELSQNGRVVAALSRGKQRWQFTAPVPDWAGENAADNLLLGLQFASLDAVVEEHPADAAKYGLQTPVARAVFSGEGFSEWLEIGAVAPASAPAAPGEPPRALRYARSSLSPAVVTVDAGLTNSLFAPEPVAREKRALPSGDWTRVRAGDAAFIRSGGVWRGESPTPAGKRLNPALFAGRLTALGTIEAAGFGGVIAGHEKDYGFDKPWRRLVLTAGADAPVEILLGAETPGGRWLKAGDRPAAVKISAEAAAQFPADANDFLEPAPVAK